MRRVATRMALVAAFAPTLVSSLATSAVAQAAGGAIEIRHPWLRATPKGAPVIGGYATITNHGATIDRVLGASLAVASEAKVHTMTNADGIMRMADVPGGLPVAPGATVTLAPEGTHLMFTHPTEQVREGMSLRGTILFEHAGAVPVTFLVGGMAARSAPGEAGP